jgi:hypothetical protein
MKIFVAAAFCLFTISAIFAEPASAPAIDSLMKGDVVFTTPDGWKMDGKANNDRLAKFSHSNPDAVMVINVDPQAQPLDNSASLEIGQMLIKKINANGKSGEYKIVDPPKMENDARFFLRIHHRFKKGEETGDQLQLYRVIKKNLVAVAVTAFTDSPDKSKELFADAEKMLLGINHGAGASGAGAATAHKVVKPATRPTALPNAHIAFNAPAGWQDETNDNAKGIVATYHDPDDNFNMIVISVQPLPAEAKKDPKVRDAVIEEMVKGEKTEYKADGATAVSENEPVKDNRFLKKARSKYEKGDVKFQVTSRQRRVGDAVVSVAMVSLESFAPVIDKLADEVALTVRPTR